MGVNALVIVVTAAVILTRARRSVVVSDCVPVVVVVVIVKITVIFKAPNVIALVAAAVELLRRRISRMRHVRQSILAAEFEDRSLLGLGLQL